MPKVSKKKIEEFIRVDHAGERGAVKIYEGQLLALNTFVKVILPLSLPGIVAGSMLVFIPVVGEYIIPEMLGGSDKLYFGKIIWDEFFVNRDWPIASALAMSGIVILVFPIIIFQLMYAKYNFKNE